MSIDCREDRRSSGRYRPLARGVAGGAALAAVLVAVTPGWAGLASASGKAGHRHHHPAPHHKLGALSGKWSGSYHGSFDGTFSLTWRELGQNLSGTILISGFGNAPTSIHGVVKGASISFGTVGSRAVTYSGSVSGNSMSGTWKLEGGGHSLGGGSWTASRSH